MKVCDDVAVVLQRVKRPVCGAATVTISARLVSKVFSVVMLVGSEVLFESARPTFG
jgi:hypothetical protein